MQSRSVLALGLGPVLFVLFAARANAQERPYVARQLPVGSFVSFYGREFELGDLNGDGTPDLVVGTTAETKAYAGDGSGRFTLSSSVPSDLDEVSLGDINGDGDLDVLGTNPNNAVLYRLFGDGNGGLSAPSTVALPSGFALLSLELRDVDGDLDLDVIGVDASPQLVSLLNDGSGNFTASASVSLVSFSSDLHLEVGDFDGDGVEDAVFTEYVAPASSLVVVRGDGLGGWLAPFTLPLFTSSTDRVSRIALGDFDFDGDADVAVVALHGTLANSDPCSCTVLENLGGSFSTWSYTPAPTITDLAVVDIDGNGTLDVAFCDINELLHFDLDPGFSAAFDEDGSVTGGRVGIRHADLDGDGDLDFVLGSTYAVTIVQASAPAQFDQVKSSINVLTPLDTGDIDGDGDVDVLCAYYDTSIGFRVVVALNVGAGSFTAGAAFSSDIVNARLGDMNGDGRLDIVTFHDVFNPRVEVRVQLANGTFAAPSVYPLPGPLFGGDLLDLENDGDPDVVIVRSGAAGTVHTFKNDGNAGLGSFTSQASGSKVQAFEASDIDGDGFGDVLCEHDDARWSVRWGSASGALSAPVSTAMTSGGADMASGDFDGDGDRDIAFLDGPNTLRWWRQDAPRSFTLTPALDLGGVPYPWGLGAADFDSDGRVDLLIDDTYAFRVLRAGPGGQFEPIGSFHHGTNFHGSAFADFDGDAFVDMVWATNDGTLRFSRHRGPDPAVTYCTAKTNSQGCAPEIGSNGAASASSAQPFTITAAQVLNHKTGLLFYGGAQLAAPFQGGTKCVASPIRRTPTTNSGGNPPPDDCSGVFAIDFNAHIQSGVDPALVPAAYVYAQWWYRDPASPSTTGLSDGLCFQIGP